MRALRHALLAAIMSLSCCQNAVAAEKLDGEAIRKAFSGNTVSGRFSSGRTFSEYHEPDGRVLGIRNSIHQPNEDGCWTTKADEICYYYGPVATRRVQCFTVERSGALFVLRLGAESGITGLAAIEAGNPRKHSDAGQPWYCDGLISRAPVAQQGQDAG